MGRPIIDLVDQTFNYLTVKSFYDVYRGNARWKCECICGRYTLVLASHLKNGGVQSCGCLRIYNCHGIITHGMTDTPTYSSWQAMHQRCYNKNHLSYSDYGGRGIKVCEEWHIFETFFKDMGLRPEGKTLDRLDVNDNYYNDNCVWSTIEEQANNKTSTTFVYYNDKYMSTRRWEKYLGFKSGVIRERLRAGWSIERALTK